MRGKKCRELRKQPRRETLTDLEREAELARLSRLIGEKTKEYEKCMEYESVVRDSLKRHYSDD